MNGYVSCLYEVFSMVTRRGETTRVYRVERSGYSPSFVNSVSTTMTTDPLVELDGLTMWS